MTEIKMIWESPGELLMIQPNGDGTALLEHYHRVDNTSCRVKLWPH